MKVSNFIIGFEYFCADKVNRDQKAAVQRTTGETISRELGAKYFGRINFVHLR